LTGKKSKKILLLPFWQKIAGVAALLAIIFLIGDFVFNDSAEQKVVNSKATKLETSEENEIPSEAVSKEGFETQNAVAVEETDPETENQNLVFKNENAGASDKSDKNVSQAENKKTVDLTKIVSTNTKKATEKTVSENRGENNASKKALPEPILSQKNGLAVVENSEKSTVSPEQKNSAQKIPDGTYASEILENGSENEVDKPKNSSPNENKKSLVEIAAAQKQVEEQPEKHLKTNLTETSKWQVKPFAAPIYYGGFGSENALDPSLAQNSSEGEVTFSYGVHFSYKVSERLKIRSGVSQVSMAYNVQDIAFMPSVKPTTLNNVSYSSEASQLEIISTSNIQNTASAEFTGRSPFTEGTLQQQMGFIEVPLEIEYALFDQKFGVSIIGGASTLFLNENTLAIDSENGTTNIGRANNLNDVSFSTNIGLGLDYEISKQFEIHLEPMFKYQINTFGENANGFQPYYFGVYTGIGFKF
ncbi:MAG TPA: hypothetical protein VFM65_11685, partial [Flavobacteriaceae bacterium]|nr:hypothetical protein [Flavobacteriaceae bacterium]